MDWQAKGEDKLENLPRFEKFLDDDYYDHYFGKGKPYARMRRWFEGQEGVHIDSAFHKFVNLKWLLPEYRTKDEFSRFVEIHTFMENGKVCYHDAFCGGFGRNHFVIEEEMSKTIYVHPVTRLICVHRPPTRKSYQSRWQAERDAKVRILGDYHQLYKQNGIWYEVKAEIVHLWKQAPNWLRSSTRFSPYLRDGKWVGYPLKAKDEILLESGGDNWKTEKNPVKIVLKRQLNSKELKKFGLTNG